MAVSDKLLSIIAPTASGKSDLAMEMADEIITKAQSPLIVVGGTPLYYKALFEGLFEGPAADEEIRQRLRNADLAQLHARLKEIDPQAASRIHVNDRKRLVRAL